MGDSERLKFVDNRYDRRHFTVVPKIVREKCNNVYEFSLWFTIKELCGEANQPIELGVSDLADLAMMSVGKASECRASLAEMGLIVLTPFKDELNRDRFEIAIRDLWAENLKLGEGGE